MSDRNASLEAPMSTVLNGTFKENDKNENAIDAKEMRTKLFGNINKNTYRKGPPRDCQYFVKDLVQILIFLELTLEIKV